MTAFFLIVSNIIVIIIIVVVVIIPVQPFVGRWPLLQFLDPIHSRKDSFHGGSACRNAAIYTQDNTNTDIRASSGIRAHDPSIRAREDSSCLRPLGHCNRPISYLLITNM
jgi:hypothetical protein